jgi:ABC-2 type transport system ATP-binding protein
MSVIEVQSIGFSYSGREALRDVTFEVEEGRLFGLLGPNGGGKTTLFRILSTLLPPQSGSARIAGWDVKQDFLEVRKVTGIAFQSNSLDLELTASENLEHQGHLHGLRGRELKSRNASLLEYFGLIKREAEPLKTFSGGLLRRVELAKALLHKPRVLLLDEPTAGLDPSAARDFWSYLEKLRAYRAMTILLTTHSMGEAEKCDLLGILHEGHLVSSGSPTDLKEAVGNEVVSISTSDPDKLKKRLTDRFEVEARIVEGVVRIEQADGHLLVAQVVEALPDLVDSITVSKPSLEDVFIQQTGHSFQDYAPAEDKA